HELRIGDTTLIRRGGAPPGLSPPRFSPPAAGGAQAQGPVLKLVTRTIEDLDPVIEAVQRAAHHERVRRLAVRCQSVFGEAYLRLVEQGFRVHWTDLRMMLRGYAPPAPKTGIVLSNWEI